MPSQFEEFIETQFDVIIEASSIPKEVFDEPETTTTSESRWMKAKLSQLGDKGLIKWTTSRPPYQAAQWVDIETMKRPAWVERLINKLRDKLT